MYSLFQNFFGSSEVEPVEVAHEPEKIEEWVILSEDLDTMKDDVEPPSVPVPQPETVHRIDMRNRKKQIQKRKGKDLIKVSRPNYSSDIRSEMSFRGTSRKTAKKNQKQFNKTVTQPIPHKYQHSNK